MSYLPQATGILVEQNEHLWCAASLFVGTAHRKLTNRFHLITVQSVKPPHAVVDICAGLQILEDGRHGHTSAL